MIVEISIKHLFRFRHGHIPNDKIKVVSFCVSMCVFVYRTCKMMHMCVCVYLLEYTFC